MTVPRDLPREFARAMRKLNKLQRRYIRALPEHRFQRWGRILNELGMSSRTVQRWFKKPSFLAVVELQQELDETRHDLSRSRFLAEIEAIGFSNPKDFVDATGKAVPAHQLDERAAAAVAEWEIGDDGFAYPKKLHSKKHAHDVLDRMHKIGPHRHEVTGKDGTPLLPATQPNELEIAKRLAYLLACGDHALMKGEAPPPA